MASQLWRCYVTKVSTLTLSYLMSICQVRERLQTEWQLSKREETKLWCSYADVDGFKLLEEIGLELDLPVISKQYCLLR
jgi:hypothetical protein